MSFTNEKILEIEIGPINEKGGSRWRMEHSYKSEDVHDTIYRNLRPKLKSAPL